MSAASSSLFQRYSLRYSAVWSSRSRNRASLEPPFACPPAHARRQAVAEGSLGTPHALRGSVPGPCMRQASACGGDAGNSYPRSDRVILGRAIVVQRGCGVGHPRTRGDCRPGTCRSATGQ